MNKGTWEYLGEEMDKVDYQDYTDYQLVVGMVNGQPVCFEYPLEAFYQCGVDPVVPRCM